MGRKPIVKLGDVFEIPLTDGRKAYGQYVYRESGGPIMRIFDYFTLPGEKPDLQEIDTKKLIFPPVYAGIMGAVRANAWKVIGELPFDDYKFEGFLNFIPEIGTNKIKLWALWDGETSHDLGSSLPKKYVKFETTAVYPADLIVERIETGFNMFDYPKKHNRFLTKEEIRKKFPKVKLDD